MYLKIGLFNRIQGIETEVPGMFITGHPPTPPGQVYGAAAVICIIFALLTVLIQFFAKKRFLSSKIDQEGSPIPIKHYSLKLILLMLFLVLFFFAGVEASLQIYVHYNPYMVFVPDPTSHWTINPAVQKSFDKDKPTHEMDGVVDTEYSRYKDPDTYRIIFLGDSQTMASPWVGSLQLTFPKLIQRKLRIFFLGRQLQTINFGVSGYSSYQGLLYFKNIGLLYNPDMVVVGLGFHDAGLSASEDKEITSDKAWVKKLRSILYRSQIYLLIRKKIYESKREKGGDSENIRRVSQEDYYNNLKQFVEIGRENNIEVVFFAVPQASPDGCSHPQYVDVMRNAAKDFDVPIIDAVKVMKDMPLSQQLTYYVEDKIHFNKEGNELMADIIYDVLKELPSIKSGY